MSYNKNEFPKFMQTAGKVTILTAITGVMVFLIAFLFDAGTDHVNRAMATSTATTTLTVLNTPPSFIVNAKEVIDSSTTTPTNSGSVIQWEAVGSDSNNAPYFLLICSTNATPTATNGTGTGTAAPACAGGVQWGVSAGTPSGATSTVSTTTTEAMAEQNDWYAWVCDDDPVSARCNITPVQGPSSTTAFSSPFLVNHRPVFSNFGNDGSVNPGATITFLSTSTDPDVVTQDDDIFLVVCNNNGGISTSTRTCNSGGLASTSPAVTVNASASYTLASIVQDNVYPAYGYLVDQHGHEASNNPIQANFTVNNVAPTALGGDIQINALASTTDLILTVPGDETTGFTLDFTLRDANSCMNTTNVPGSEITGYTAVVYRTSIGTSTCNGTAGSYNPNNCYPSGVSAATWNLSCTASTTSCSGPTDDTLVYNCSFPLWFVADPTDGGINTPLTLANDTWSAAVSGTDDDAAIGPLVGTSNPVELISFTALDLLTAQIPYGPLEPGSNTGSLNASTTAASVGNTGLDQMVLGESMCGTFSIGNECPVSATSTVPESEQRFSSSSVAYTSPAAVSLSSSTAQEVELNVAKTQSTTTPNAGITYWGIAVPASITLAGSYQGLNTFYGRTAEAVDWGI